VDGSDYNLWNSHKFTSSDGAQAIPEPVSVVWLVVWGTVMARKAAYRAPTSPQR
jgi:hypothetical protein